MKPEWMCEWELMKRIRVEGSRGARETVSWCIQRATKLYAMQGSAPATGLGGLVVTGILRVCDRCAGLVKHTNQGRGEILPIGAHVSWGFIRIRDWEIEGG